MESDNKNLVGFFEEEVKHKDIQFEISEADKNLFAEMGHASQSGAERKFFSTLEYKEQYESAFANELLVYEKENSDGIYLLRKYYDTYLIGYCKGDGKAEEYECETLAEALSLHLDECVGFPRSITLHEWLRMSGYHAVRYDRNYDDK